MRNNPSLTRVTTLATAIFLTAFASAPAEGKPSKGPGKAKQSFAECNAEREKLNESMSSIRMKIIAATYPQYFTLYTAQKGDTWDGLYKSSGMQSGLRQNLADADYLNNDIIAMANNTKAPLTAGTRVVLPSRQAASDQGINEQAYAIIYTYGGSAEEFSNGASRVIPCDKEWNLGTASDSNEFDEKVATCFINAETKGADLKQCIGNGDLQNFFADTNVLSCEESLGSPAKCRQRVRRDCQRAMRDCDAKLRGDATALLYLRVAHDRITAQKLKTYGQGKR